MTKWIQLTNAHDGRPIWVNVPKYCEMVIVPEHEGVPSFTRMFTGTVALAESDCASSQEHYCTDVSEAPETIIAEASK